MVRGAGWSHGTTETLAAIRTIRRSALYDLGNAAATAANIVAHEGLLRLSVVSSVVCQICFVFLVVALHRLFADVHETSAKLMVSLVVAAVPIAIANELFNLAALELGTGASTRARSPTSSGVR